MLKFHRIRRTCGTDQDEAHDALHHNNEIEAIPWIGEVLRDPETCKFKQQLPDKYESAEALELLYGGAVVFSRLLEGNNKRVDQNHDQDERVEAYSEK